MRKFLFIFLTVLLVSCNSSENSAIVGEWELNYMQIGNEKLSAIELGNPIYTFFDNNTYQIKISKMEQVGYWKYNHPNLTLEDTTENSEPAKAIISEITDSTIVYDIFGKEDVKTTVYLKK